MATTRRHGYESWWAQRWLEMLDVYGEEQRSPLHRGRSDARAGRVWPLAIGPGLIVANVQDSYSMFYRVEVEVPLIAHDAWRQVEDALAREAWSLAALLAGEMPAGIEDLFTMAGTHLFPESAEELTATCTCLSWSSLCRHVAATYHAVAIELERDPFLLLTLRGRTRQQLITRVRAAWSSALGGPAREVTAASRHSTDASTTPLHAARFYAAGVLDLAPTAGKPPDEPLIRRLGRPPFAKESEDIGGVLDPVYAAVTRAALATLHRGERDGLDHDAATDAAPDAAAAPEHTAAPDFAASLLDELL